MCGIAGILSSNPGNTGMARLQSMADALAHRGPDGEGFWHNPAGIIGFAHRRLSILDKGQTGAQPMHYHHRYSIVYNGEIYNYKELRQQLEHAGHEFKSSGDTEVLLAAYAEYGEDCLELLEGMFAFAIWDEKMQTLFCARDRFGEKPFYYFKHDGEFYFASEMKALWAIGITKHVNDSMLGRYLALGYVQNPNDSSETFYQNIYALPPGTFVCYQVNEQKWRLKEYFTIRKDFLKKVEEKDAASIIDTLLKNSVKRRLRSDVKVGSSLSGGLDSSAIAAYIHGITGAGFDSFSAIFPGYARDESEHIAKMVTEFGLKSHTVTPTADGLINDFEKLAWHQEEPFTSSGVYAQYKVFEQARKMNVPVLLDGQGADELFAGYIKYVHWYLQTMAARGKFRLVSRELDLFKENGHDIEFGVRNYLAAFLPSHTAMALESREHKKLRNSSFLHPDFAAQFATNSFGIQKPTVNKLNDLLHFNMLQMGLQELLRYADRNSMAHGVEVRLPFLDTSLVKFIFSLPGNFKISNGYTKSILRKTMKGRLPEDIVWRKDKVGFETPQKNWMAEPLMKEYLHAAKEKLVAEKYLDKKVLGHIETPVEIHAPNNEAWRFISAAQLIKI